MASMRGKTKKPKLCEIKREVAACTIYCMFCDNDSTATHYSFFKYGDYEACELCVEKAKKTHQMILVRSSHRSSEA